MNQQQFHFQKTPDQNWSQSLHKTRPNLNTNLNGFLLHTTNDNIKSCDLDLTYFIFWREDNIKLPFWSGLHLLKLACFFSFKSNSNKTLKPMQDFNGWNVEEMKHSHRWERGVNKGRRWKFGNYTCETHHGAHTHTPLMQTAVLQEKHWSLRMFAYD